MSTAPFVSVIIPARNSQESIRLLLDSLSRADYPAAKLEVLVIDNGSTDQTRKVVEEYPAVKLLEEISIRSSYAARNRGIEQARGEILAFTDADCIVTAGWISNGVRAIAGGSADLVGGRVEFFLSSGMPAAEIFDAASHMHSEDLVATGKGAATANLFVNAAVFRRIGAFPQSVRSGGDMIWTRLALSKGYRLAYAPDAIVRHPARNMHELLRKAFRVGLGSPQIVRRDGSSPTQLALGAMRSILPGGPGSLRRRIQHHGFAITRPVFLRVWLVSYLYGLTWAAGVFMGFGRSLVRRTPPQNPETGSAES